jgi:vacuolar protein sorting-associated protein 13A/C
MIGTADMPGSDAKVILTTKFILSAVPKRATVEWELPFTRLSGVQIEDTGVRFADKAGSEYDRFVACPDRVTQGWFFSSVARVVKSYNARRRIEK